MSGTQTYDMIMLATVVALVAIIVFWSARYGADMIAGALAQSPHVIQQSIVSYFASLCSVEGDADIKYKFPVASSFTVNIGEEYVSVSQDKAETGGINAIRFSTPEPAPYARCGLEIKKGDVKLPKGSNFIEVVKTGKVVEVLAG